MPSRWKRRAITASSALIGWVSAWVLVSPAAAIAEGGRPQTSLNAAIILNLQHGFDEAAVDAVRGHLADLPVILSVEGPDALPATYEGLYRHFGEVAIRNSADIVFTAKLDAAEDATLYVSLPETGTTLIRHIDTRTETIEGRRELVGVIIRGFVTAMAIGGEIGVHIPEAPRGVDADTDAARPEPDEATPESDEAPAPSPLAPVKQAPITAPARSFAPASMGVGYGILFPSPDMALMHAIRLEIAADIRRIHAFVAYRWVVPALVSRDHLELTLSLHPIELGGGFQQIFNRVQLLFGLSVVFDIATLRATAHHPSVAMKTFDGRWLRVALAPMTRVDFSPLPNTRVYVGFSLDILPQRSAVSATIGEEATALLMDLRHISPFVHLGLTFGIGG